MWTTLHWMSMLSHTCPYSMNYAAGSGLPRICGSLAASLSSMARSGRLTLHVSHATGPSAHLSTMLTASCLELLSHRAWVPTPAIWIRGQCAERTGTPLSTHYETVNQAVGDDIAP